MKIFFILLQEKALKLTERLAIAKDLSIFEGMSLINTGSARSARSYEPLALDPKTRESQLEERIVNNVGDFLNNHVLQLRLSEESENESRDLDEEGNVPIKLMLISWPHSTYIFFWKTLDIFFKRLSSLSLKKQFDCSNFIQTYYVYYIIIFLICNHHL